MNRFTLNRFDLLFYFLILFILTINSLIFSQNTDIRFKHLSYEDGLPSDRFNCIIQDHLGFIWIGTSNGFSKYDGYEFVNYIREEDDSTGLIGINIRSIMEDSDGDIWAGTYYGISILLRDENRFVSYEYDKNNNKSLSNNWVRKMFQDSKGNMWVGTNGGGLNFIDKNSFRDKREKLIFQRANLNYYVESTEYIFDIIEDSKGIIWVCTGNGLLKILDKDPELIQAIPSNNYNVKNNFMCIVEDNTGIFWIGTSGNGIISYNPDTNEFMLLDDTKNKNNHSFNNISSLLLDSKGNLWAGSNENIDGGLCLYNRATNEYSKFINDPLNPYSISKEYGPIRTILEDTFGNIWIPIHHGSINIINPSNKLSYFRNYNVTKNSILLSKKTRIMESKNGRIWFGAENGLFEYLPNEERFEKEKAVNDFENCSLEKRCESLAEDLSGNIWTSGINVELRKFNLTNKLLTCFDKNDDMPQQNVSSIIADKAGNIWLGRYGGGIIKYSTVTEQSTKYRYIHNDSTTISNDYVLAMTEDSSNSLWISTADQWLNKLDMETGEVKRIKFSESKGYFSDLFIDTKNRLWASTNFKGIYLFDTKNDNYKVIKKSHGLPSNDNLTGFSEDYNGNIYCCTGKYLIKFNQSARFEGSFAIGTEDEQLHQTYIIKNTGQMFVVSDRGFYNFNVDSLKPNNIPPKIVLTSMKLKDKFLEVGNNSLLKKHINVAKEIQLEYWQNDITIQFAGINFVNQNDNRYKYILENYDENWRDAGVRREATYTNLKYGKYRFKAIGSNSSGIWANEPATLSIVIYPPWWVTWWAYLIYSVLLIIILSSIYFLQRKRLKIIHQLEMKNFEAEKLKDLDKMKSRFFENISHEFKTPLTLIKGPVEKLLEDESVSNPREIYQTIKKNSDRLLKLINELLSLSKLESGKLKLTAQKGDIVSFVRALVLSFESLAKERELKISFSSSSEIIEVYFDQEKMQKILTNLLSNGIKFTNKGGLVSVSVEEVISEQKLYIKISDNGIGIPKKELQTIFDRFHRANIDYEGTGIGLSLTKELIEVHYGNIKVESTVGKGSTFSISFPLGKTYLKDEEIIEKESDLVVSEEEENDEYDLTKEKDEEKPIVLVVEDNKDVREFIIAILKNEFKLYEAKDGEQGHDMALEHMPDLIVSDVMMPKLNGDKMCEKLKQNHITSHIPIILLTAKSSTNDKVSGLELGADDYLVKPFSNRELLTRINNLIVQRRALREKYLREAEFNPTEVAVTSTDKKFVENVLDAVERNYSNSKFGVEQMADELSMSRIQLYRKFTQILGEKPTDFIKKYRIKKAANLIKQKFGNITEIAYAVGFDNLSYFAKCFKQIYNQSPHKFEKNYLNKVHE